MTDTISREKAQEAQKEDRTLSVRGFGHCLSLPARFKIRVGFAPSAPFGGEPPFQVFELIRREKAGMWFVNGIAVEVFVFVIV